MGPQSPDFGIELTDGSPIVDDVCRGIAPLDVVGLGGYPVGGILTVHTAVYRPAETNRFWRIDDDPGPPRPQEIGREWELNDDVPICQLGDTTTDFGPNVWVGHLLQSSKLYRIGEHYGRQHCPVDSPVYHHHRPAIGYRAKRGASRFKDRVSDQIRLDHNGTELTHHLHHRRLAAADPATDDHPQRASGIALGSHDVDCTLWSMITVRDPWEQRLDWVLSAVLWASLTLSVIVTAVADGATANVGISALLAGAYVVAMQVFPRRIRNSDQWGELLAVLGVIVALIAMALTGGAESAYVIFLTGPPLFAASFLGLRVGLETAALAIAGLMVIARALDQPLLSGSTVLLAFLYALIGITFSQVRRIMIETSERSAELQVATARIERIQSAHTLLSSLSELANTQELNPVSIGTVALRDLAESVPLQAGRIRLVREDGEAVVVAMTGEIADEAPPHEYPIQMRGNRLGSIELWPQTNVSLERHEPAIQPIVRQVGLAFDNVGLVQRIAHRTVYEERIRLARELHDNIGPALASLGLRLDMLIYQVDDEPEVRRHLEGTRTAVTALVEEVRTTVADLRHDNVASIVEQAYEIAAESAGAGPEITIAIQEHRPPRPAVAVELRAIITEAVRNSIEHSRATALHIEGEVDRDRGRITIRDNGQGFDTSSLPQGHYGVLGMHERAAEIGGTLSIDSDPGRGSRVTIAWEAD